MTSLDPVELARALLAFDTVKPRLHAAVALYRAIADDRAARA